MYKTSYTHNLFYSRTNKNAVLTQIWIALIYYLFLLYIIHQSRHPKSLSFLVKVIPEVLFMSVNIEDILKKDEGRGINVSQKKNNSPPMLTFRKP